MELGVWEEPVAREDEETGNEELYLGTSSSSQYTFSAAETSETHTHTKFNHKIISLELKRSFSSSVTLTLA